MTTDEPQVPEPGDADDKGEPAPEARNWATLTHLSALVMFIGIPAVVGPLVVWLLKRHDDPYIDYHGKEAVNFNISILIYGIISFVLVFVLIGILLLLVVGVAWLVLLIIAAVKASSGEHYRYPLTIRFLS